MVETICNTIIAVVFIVAGTYLIVKFFNRIL